MKIRWTACSVILEVALSAALAHISRQHDMITVRRDSTAVSPEYGIQLAVCPSAVIQHPKLKYQEI